jgi:hypothetical protein
MTTPVFIFCLVLLPLLLARKIRRAAPDAQKELEKADRREAARRSVDNLLP